MLIIIFLLSKTHNKHNSYHRQDINYRKRYGVTVNEIAPSVGHQRHSLARFTTTGSYSSWSLATRTAVRFLRVRSSQPLSISYAFGRCLHGMREYRTRSFPTIGTVESICFGRRMLSWQGIPMPATNDSIQMITSYLVIGGTDSTQTKREQCALPPCQDLLVWWW